jgi:hypothetical protein
MSCCESLAQIELEPGRWEKAAAGREIFDAAVLRVDYSRARLTAGLLAGCC